MSRASRLAALAAGLAVVAAAPASADHKHGVDVDVIASKLDNPRHVAVAKGGDVYVAESGRGGDHATSKSCFDTAEGFACTGATGAVTRIGRRGQRRVVTGLASFAPVSGNSAIGPHGIYVDGDDVYFTNGGPTGPTRGDPPEVVLRDPTLVAEEPVSALYGTLRKVRNRGGSRQIADIWRFEHDNNPDAADGNPLIDSNAVDVYADHGRFFVADAGGNTVLRVGRFGGISPVAIFPNIEMPFPFPPPPDTVDMQAVPTGVVKGPDGALYVSQLTGFPFPVGGAKVFRIDPRGGLPTVYAEGLTNAMDLAFGRDGTLYVLEIDADSLLGPSTDGALFAVPLHDPHTSKQAKQVELPADTLTEPGGIAVGRHGDLFVSNHAREARTGEVLKIDLR
jgi:hypothetical protein